MKIEKQMKPLILALASVAMGSQLCPAQIYHKGWIDFNKNGKMDVYENPKADIESRVADLISQMNMDEKTCQLATLYGSGRVLSDSLPTPLWKEKVWKDGIGNIDEQANGLGSFGKSISFPYATSIDNRHQVQRWFVEQTRLGIPVDFTNEGIRGLCHDRATMFPAQSGQGATWDKDLISEIARVTAEEAKALGYTNIYSPILDIAQDPRWGRAVESYGEDPFLVGTLGTCMVKGLQERGVAATPKHFAVYSIPVGGRDGDTRTDPKVAPREMRTLYLYPFRKAIMEAHPMGVMSSYNDYDGVPITGSYKFLTEILRDEFGFDGYVVSDSHAVEYLHDKHTVAKDAVEGAAMAINAGLNVRTNFTAPEEFIDPLREAVKRGLITEETINSRVADVLRVKMRLGLFDNPYPGDQAKADAIVHSPEHKAVSKRAAMESMVLLKNDNAALPLSKSLSKVAVIGPNANEIQNLICRYGPANAPIKTVYDGIAEYLPNADVRYAKGCDIIDKHFPESELYNVPLDSAEQAMIDEAVALAKDSEVAIMVLGGNERTVRESFSRTSLDLCGRQQQLLEAVYATGTPVVLVMVDGRAASINWAQKYVPAILHAWFPGEFMGDAVAATLFGDNNPGGRLAVTFPKTVGQIPFAFPFKPGSDSESFVRVGGALYPFGHGLSYTTFDYSDLDVKVNPDNSVTVNCTITNTGSRKGDEVAQLYIRDLVSSSTRYVKELRGFERISLEPGQSEKVTFTMTPEDLSIINDEGRYVLEPGDFNAMVGSSSTDIRLSQQFTIK